MSKRAPVPDAAGSLLKSLIEQLYHHIMELEGLSTETGSDAKSAAQLDDLFAAAAMLSQAPAGSLRDLLLKLDVLCRRLREVTSPISLVRL